METSVRGGSRTPRGFKSGEEPSGEGLSPVDPTAVVDPLHRDDLFGGRERREESILSYPEFTFVGAD